MGLTNLREPAKAFAQTVAFGFGVVKHECRPDRAGQTQAAHQCACIQGSAANDDSFAIESQFNFLRLHPIDVERDDRYTAATDPDDFDFGNLSKAVGGVLNQSTFCRLDIGEPEFSPIFQGGAEGYNLGNCFGSCLELLR